MRAHPTLAEKSRSLSEAQRVDLRKPHAREACLGTDLGEWYARHRYCSRVANIRKKSSPAESHRTRPTVNVRRAIRKRFFRCTCPYFKKRVVRSKVHFWSHTIVAMQLCYRQIVLILEESTSFPRHSDSEWWFLRLSWSPTERSSCKLNPRIAEPAQSRDAFPKCCCISPLDVLFFALHRRSEATRVISSLQRKALRLKRTIFRFTVWLFPLRNDFRGWLLAAVAALRQVSHCISGCFSLFAEPSGRRC